MKYIPFSKIHTHEFLRRFWGRGWGWGEGRVYGTISRWESVEERKHFGGIFLVENCVVLKVPYKEENKTPLKDLCLRDCHRGYHLGKLLSLHRW